jgi:hypothetical protein
MHLGTVILPFGKIYYFADPLIAQNLIIITLFLPNIDKFGGSSF